MGEQQIILEHDAHLARFGGQVDACTRIVEGDTGQADPARLDLEETGDGCHGSRLARPIGAEEGHGPPRGDSQIELEPEFVTPMQLESRFEPLP